MPATHDIPTFAQLFGSSFSDREYQADWVAFGYDSESGYFVPELVDPLLVGSSLWLIHDTGSDMVIDVNVDGSFRNASARQICPGETVSAISEFESSSEDVVWLFTASPFPSATLVSDWLVITNDSTTGSLVVTISSAANSRFCLVAMVMTGTEE